MRTVPVILIALALCGPTLAQEPPHPVDLRPVWKAAQASRYRITQTERTEMVVAGLAEAQSSVTDVEAVVTWEVVEAAEGGGGTARMTLESMSMKILGADGKTRSVTASAADEPLEPARQYIAALSGSPVTVQVAADGSIASVTGFEAIRAKAGQAGERIDEEFFRELARDLSALTGGQSSVASGTTWQHAHSSPHALGRVRYAYTDKLAGVERMAGIPVAVIERKAAVTFEPELPPRPADAPPIQVATRDASYESQLMFDLSRHELVGAAMRQTLVLEITTTVGDRAITRTVREATEGQILRISEQPAP
jgi:hypothetical protein